MTEAPHVTIWHNPDCGTSRNTLALIRNAGIEPTIVEYLKTPPTREELVSAIAAAGLTVRAKRSARRTRLLPNSGSTILRSPTSGCWITCWPIRS